MNLSSPAIESSPSLKSQPVSKVRWAAALVFGTVLFLLSFLASNFIPSALFNLTMVGPTYAFVGVLQLLLAPVGIALALRIVRLRIRDVGLTTTQLRKDSFIGLTVAFVFALLQFLVVIPNTGGAERSDIVANAAQIGDSIWGVFGFVVLAWTGVFSEELFWRGHFVTTLRNFLGNTRIALYLTVVITMILFAAGHGYQGWAGIIDTGLYGGLIMTLLYLWRGRLTAPFVAHAMWNTLATIVIYLW